VIDFRTFQGRIALHRQDAEVLYEVALLGKTYVEIGTLFGGSACIAGLAGCEVFCIDPLDGYYSTKHKKESRIDSASGLVPSARIVRENWESCGLDPAKLHIYQQHHPPWPLEINRTFDIGLIDGDHLLDGVLLDYLGMSPRVDYLMFHDINKRPVNYVWARAIRGGWEEYTTKNESYILGTLRWRPQ